MCESRSDPASAQWQTDTLLKCLTAKNITILPFKTLSHSTLCRTITILKLTEDLNTSCFKGAGFSFCPSFQKHFEVLLVVRCIHGDVKWSRIAWQLLTRLPWNLVWIFLVPRPLLLISVATQSFYCATIVWHSRLFLLQGATENRCSDWPSLKIPDVNTISFLDVVAVLILLSSSCTVLLLSSSCTVSLI